MPHITVSQIPNIGIPEDSTHEFKTSIFIAPGTQGPGAKQMTEIAKSLAAFMNADGGELYLGVKDDGSVVGIDDDLAILAGPNVVAKGPFASDEGHAYAATDDKYILKIRAIVKAYLETFACEYVKDIQVGKIGGQKLVRIVVDPVPSDKIVYFNRKIPNGPYVQEIYVRRGNEKNNLIGFDRDQFVRERFAADMMKKMRQVKADAPKISAEELLQGFQAMIAPQLMQGASVVVTGGQPLTENAIKPMSSPKGLIFDGEHVRDAKTWKDCYLALLEKLQSLDAAKFDALPDDAFFKKYFIRQVPHTRCTGCYGAKFGTAANVRAKEVANKVYFYNSNYVVYKLLAHFGIAAERVMIRAS